MGCYTNTPTNCQCCMFVKTPNELFFFPFFQTSLTLARNYKRLNCWSTTPMRILRVSVFLFNKSVDFYKKNIQNILSSDWCCWWQFQTLSRLDFKLSCIRMEADIIMTKLNSIIMSTITWVMGKSSFHNCLCFNTKIWMVQSNSPTEIKKTKHLQTLVLLEGRSRPWSFQDGGPDTSTSRREVQTLVLPGGRSRPWSFQKGGPDPGPFRTEVQTLP